MTTAPVGIPADAPAQAEATGVVVIGSGLAGYTLARELRKLDKASPLTVITADGGEVYSKPMLSNALTQNKAPPALVQKTAAVLAAELDITILTRTRVTAIDRATRTVALHGPDGTPAGLPYARLVLALGADARPYRVPGSEAVAVASVNDLDDYRRWHAGLGTGGSKAVLLIGAGLIGCEFANDLIAAGHAVTVVDPGPWPVARLLPEPAGQALAAALADSGVSLRLGRSVACLRSTVDGGMAELDDGSVVTFDAALSAIGLVPRTALAEAAGLALSGGIAVDRLMRTSDRSIFALGDCAATEAGPLPFVLPLMAQAKALARTLAGQETPLLLPALPVAVKTPALPVVVCPPSPGATGGWRVEGEGRNLTARFLSPDGRPLGFALTGTCTSQRQSLVKDMPDLLG